MELRLIHQSKKVGIAEQLYFTEDFDSPADDFVTPGYELNSDTVVEFPGKFSPSGFPIETSFSYQG